MIEALKKLQKILNNAKVSDEMIQRGVNLTDVGKAKVAKSLGIEITQVNDAINQLAAKLASEGERHAIIEGSERYSFESDIMGNVTVRDNESGAEKLVRGSEGQKLLKELDFSSNPQMILASLFQVNESSDDGFSEELGGRGTYNFPFRDGSGTAAYRMNGGNFELRVVSLRDRQGEEIDASEQDYSEAVTIAERFIDDA